MTDPVFDILEIRLRVKYERLPGRADSVDEIAQDLADQCTDLLHYQHKDNEDAMVEVALAERIDMTEPEKQTPDKPPVEQEKTPVEASKTWPPVVETKGTST